MKQMNQVMTLAIMLFISGQAVSSARVKPVANDPYAQYGIPADAVGSVAETNQPIRSQKTRPAGSKAVKPAAQDSYVQYGMPADAVGEQEYKPQGSWVRYIKEPKAKPAARDPYEYGMPEEAIGSEEIYTSARPTSQDYRQNRWKNEERDAYMQARRKAMSKRNEALQERFHSTSGQTMQAVGLQEPVARRGKMHKKIARKSSYEPIDAEILD